MVNILLVDDDEDDRLVFVNAAEALDADIQCTTAQDGFEGIRILKNELLVSPDYIFLDLNMPGMTGFECLAELKKIPGIRSIPVIVYTTSNNESDMRQAFRQGAYGYICKPNHFADLKNILHTILVEHAVTLSEKKIVFK